MPISGIGAGDPGNGRSWQWAILAMGGSGNGRFWQWAVLAMGGSERAIAAIGGSERAIPDIRESRISPQSDPRLFFTRDRPGYLGGNRFETADYVDGADVWKREQFAGTRFDCHYYKTELRQRIAFPNKLAEPGK